MSTSDEEIDLIATKLDEAYHGDLSDCPILLDARDMLLALKARAEALEKDRDNNWQEYLAERISIYKARAEAAEKECEDHKLALAYQVAQFSAMTRRVKELEAALEPKP